MDGENSFGSMARSTKANLKMILDMGKVYTDIQMVVKVNTCGKKEK